MNSSQRVKYTMLLLNMAQNNTISQWFLPMAHLQVKLTFNVIPLGNKTFQGRTLMISWYKACHNTYSCPLCWLPMADSVNYYVWMTISECKIKKFCTSHNDACYSNEYKKVNEILKRDRKEPTCLLSKHLQNIAGCATLALPKWRIGPTLAPNYWRPRYANVENNTAVKVAWYEIQKEGRLWGP